jgi:nitronate monooxygenase
LGFLREAYRTADGEVGYRCGAEPLSLYLSKGGHAGDTIGKKCICNGLLANIGFAQVLNGNRVELGIVTAGDDLTTIQQFLPPNQTHYSALDVIAELQRGTKPVPPQSTAA